MRTWAGRRPFCFLTRRHGGAETAWGLGELVYSPGLQWAGGQSSVRKGEAGSFESLVRFGFAGLSAQA